MNFDIFRINLPPLHLISTSFPSFYILLRGRVSIYILTSLADGEDVDETVRKMREADQQARASSPRQHLDRSKFGNFIVQLGETLNLDPTH